MQAMPQARPGRSGSVMPRGVPVPLHWPSRQMPSGLAKSALFSGIAEADETFNLRSAKGQLRLKKWHACASSKRA